MTHCHQLPSLPAFNLQGFSFFCLFVSASECLLGVGDEEGLSSISSIQGLQLTRPPFVNTQRQLCPPLCPACHPVLLMFRPASSFLSSPTALPPDCDILSECGSEWGAFSPPPGIYLTLSWSSSREALMPAGGGTRCLLGLQSNFFSFFFFFLALCCSFTYKDRNSCCCCCWCAFDVVCMSQMCWQTPAGVCES